MTDTSTLDNGDQLVRTSLFEEACALNLFTRLTRTDCSQSLIIQTPQFVFHTPSSETAAILFQFPTYLISIASLQLHYLS